MRRAAVVSLLALLGGLIASTATRPAQAAAPAEKPRVKLAVLVVFDQMRGDFLDKWKPLFGAGGFARLQADGAWFTDSSASRWTFPSRLRKSPPLMVS